MPDIINVGGGFPSIYPDLNPEPLNNYLNEIKIFKKFEDISIAQGICEPGRAIVAESGSDYSKSNVKKKTKLIY